jgi:hypothetical protein
MSDIYTFVDCPDRKEEIITPNDFLPLHLVTTDPLLLDWSECTFKKNGGCCVNRISEGNCPRGYANTFEVVND